MIDTLIALYALKDETRTGWVLRGIDRPESVADHSWGTALLCLLYATGERVDRDRCVRMAVVHDAAEAIVGDIATRVDPAARTVAPDEKARLEREAIDRLFGPVASVSGPGSSHQPPAEASGDASRLWEEYEAARTEEARFVRDMNLVDMVLQALIYETQRRYDSSGGSGNFPDFARLDEFFATSRPRISTKTGRLLFEEIERRYRNIRS